MSLVEYYWRGNGPLWKIFWIYGVAVSVGLAALIANGCVSKVGRALPGLIAMLVGLVVYTIWVVVSIWRCADNIQGVRSALIPPYGVRCRARSLWRGSSTPSAAQVYSLK